MAQDLNNRQALVDALAQAATRARLAREAAAAAAATRAAGAATTAQVEKVTPSPIPGSERQP